jgi:hypothetical protein
MALETVISASVKAVETNPLDLATANAAVSLVVSTALANGTGANQASKIFSDTRSIALSANEDLDLAGSLTSNFGATLTFATVKAILIRAKATNTNNVVVGPAAVTGFLGPFADAADRVAIKPGGTFLVTAPGVGWTVGAGSADLFNVANSGAGSAVEYDVVIVGT